MSAEDREEENRLRSAALQTANTILQARHRAEEELLAARERLLAETRLLEILNVTGAKIASNLDLESLVQAVTEASTQLSGARFGAFFHTQREASGDVFLLYTLSGAPREAFEKLGRPRATALFGPIFRGETPFAPTTFSKIHATAARRLTTACRRATCRCAAISPCR